MTKPKTMIETRCPACGSPNLGEPLLPYCSLVCRRLGRLGLGWLREPYRIVVASHPYMIVQTGPAFDLRESVLKGARDRALATERKRRQRRAERLRNVTPTPQDDASIGATAGISGVENLG